MLHGIPGVLPLVKSFYPPSKELENFLSVYFPTCSKHLCPVKLIYHESPLVIPFTVFIGNQKPGFEFVVFPFCDLIGSHLQFSFVVVTYYSCNYKYIILIILFDEPYFTGNILSGEVKMKIECENPSGCNLITTLDEYRSTTSPISPAKG